MIAAFWSGLFLGIAAASFLLLAALGNAVRRADEAERRAHFLTAAILHGGVKLKLPLEKEE